MDPCVVNGASHCLDGDRRNLSVRSLDEDRDRPLVTVEVSPGSGAIPQIRRPNNVAVDNGLKAWVRAQLKYMPFSGGGGATRWRVPTRLNRPAGP